MKKMGEGTCKRKRVRKECEGGGGGGGGGGRNEKGIEANNFSDSIVPLIK